MTRPASFQPGVFVTEASETSIEVETAKEFKKL